MMAVPDCILTKVKLELTDGNYTKAAVKENAVRYNDVFDGVDVQYTLNALGMKEDIILNKYVDKSSLILIRFINIQQQRPKTE